MVIAVCFLAGLAVLLPGAATQGLTWSPLIPLQAADNNTSGPAARRGFAFGYDPLGDQLVVFGGSTSNGVTNDTWIFDISTESWSEVRPTRAPSARTLAYYGIVRVSGRSLFVVALGLLNPMVEFDDVWVLDLTEMQWSPIEPRGDGPGPRYGGHFGAAFGDSDTFWIGSGFTETTPLQTRYIDTYKLTFASATEASWERVYAQPSSGNQFMPLSPHGRCLHASTVIADAGLVMAGGCMRGGTGGGPCPTDDTWYFNDDRNRWEGLNRCITPRTFGGMASLSNSSGKAVLYGGNDQFSKQLLHVAAPYPQDEVFVVDVNADGNEWKRYSVECSGECPERRLQFGMAAGPNDTIYMFGGQSLSSKALMDDLWILSGDVALTEEVSCNNRWFSYAHLHGLLMFLAFGVLFPTGIIVAFCCARAKAGFIAHVIIQITAAIIAVVAFIIIFAVSERAGQIPSHPHAIIGIFLMFFMLLQPINGIFRPHIKKGEDKTKYRICWEWFHRIYGNFVVLLGLVQVTLGVFLIVAPNGVWIVWIIMLVAWLVTFVVNYTIRIICRCCCKRGGRYGKCGGDKCGRTRSKCDGKDGYELKQ